MKHARSLRAVGALLLVTDPQGTSATHLSWNRTIAPGGSVTFGFIGATPRPDGDVTTPGTFLLNGRTCT